MRLYRYLYNERVPTCAGEMAEWLKAHAWKACLGETLTWVRIPLSPPFHLSVHCWKRSFAFGSGFRLAAQTPRKRLKFESHSLRHFHLSVHCWKRSFAFGSGFRLAAQTPRKRLKFESHSLRHFTSAFMVGRGPSPSAQDFASRLRRRENGSSSNPTLSAIQAFSSQQSAKANTATFFVRRS